MLGKGFPEFSSGLGGGPGQAGWGSEDDGKIGAGGGSPGMLGMGGVAGGPGNKMAFVGVFFCFQKLSVYMGPLETS